MSGLRDRLLRLRGGECAGRAETPADDPQRHGGFEAIGAAAVENEWGCFLLRRRTYPAAHRHGRYALAELAEAAPRLAPIAARQNRARRSGERPAGSGPAAAGVAGGEAGPLGAMAADRLLFLDTETTGLGVGAGNLAFLIGIGFVEGDGFVVEQLFMRHPGEERAMLGHLLTRLQERTHLVTYNGRTFDWPVLVNRFILNGWRKSGADPGQLDFLHPARALWRNVLPSCRLGRIEEDRLGVIRDEDVPGALAPTLYFRYLADGDPAPLAGVYAHNEQDVLTLAALTIHFGRMLDESRERTDLRAFEAEELFSTAWWLDQHGQTARADELFLELGRREADVPARLWLQTAARWKRLGRLEQALPLWRRAGDWFESAALPQTEAHVELAIAYEHKLKDPATALRYAEGAVRLLERLPAAAHGAQRRREERERLLRRVERLRRKLARVRDSVEGETE